MRYQGGKSRIAKALATEIRKRFPTTTDIWELFCGGGAMTLALAKAGFRVHASDNHEDLILMWQALMRGETEPFVDVTREEHARLKHAEPSARRGFVRFGASFGGDFFGGFGTDIKNGEGHQPWQEAQRSRSSRRSARLYGSTLQWNLRLPRSQLRPRRLLGFVKKRTGPTFVSELNGPEDLEIVWRQQHNSQMVSNAAATAGRIKQREERLYFWPGSNVRPTDPPASK